MQPARTTKVLLTGWMGFILAVLYFPFLIMFVLSWQGPRGGHAFPLSDGYPSDIWYWKLFHPGQVTQFSDVGEFLGDYLAAFQRSIILAAAVMIISTVLALLGAMAFRRGFRLSGLVFYLWLLGLIIPGISVSLALALFFKQLGIPQEWYSTGLAVHVMWTLPFCLIIFLIAFNRFDERLEDAALMLGANRWQAFRHVTLPNIKFGVLSSLLFGFTLSLDEFQRSLLIEGADQTLPLMVMSSVTTRITPTLYALGTLTTLVSFLVIGLYLAFAARSARRARQTPVTGADEVAGAGASA